MDYFPKNNRKWAYQCLLESLKLRAGRLGISMEKPVPLVGQIANLSMPVEDEFAKAERERKAREERDRLAAQKAENERIARQQAEAERTAKAERDRLARQKTEERRKATAEAFRKINSKRILAIGGIVIALIALFFVGKFIIENLPASPAATSTFAPVSTLIPTKTRTPTLRPPTELPTITFTPAPGVGSAWTSPKDGMVMMFVPAGKFLMGNDGGSSDEQPAHDVTLADFWIDKTEVTNAMYARCVEAGGCTSPSSTSSYTRQSYYGNSEFGDFPVISVSWNDAHNYCEWRGDGTRLPSESEWEKAASWDDDKKEKRVYPWGDSIDCSFANYYGKNGACTGDTTKVGSYPSGASFYGLLDMAGNVWEWVSSLYQAYPYNSSDGREDLSASGDRALRGGSWYGNDYYVRTSYRYRGGPAFWYNYLGFRCSRSP